MVKMDDPRARRLYGDPPSEDEEELVRMSFGEHLDELRKRLWRSLIAVVIACLVFMPMHDQVLEIVVGPYRILWKHSFEEYVADLEQQEKDGVLDEVLGKDYLEFSRKYKDAILDGTFRYPGAIQGRTGFQVPYSLVATGGLDDFWTFMMASLIFALVVASPVVIWQIWAFISAGLYKRERRAFRRYFPFMMGLLAAGVLFGYFFVVPFGLGFLIKMMNSGQVAPLLSVSQYFSLLFFMTMALGIVFQLPVVMVALQKVGLVSHATMRRHWRWVVLVICIASAVLTPTPDPVTMFLVASPAMLLYVLGLVLTARMKPGLMAASDPPGGTP
ncbi:MAG: hypothetical protein Fur0037_28730 [Planctomycetota bacterium]